MSQARAELLARIADDVGRNGLGDRSLRAIARSIGTSHRMVLYHFGDRAGLVRALVEMTEQAQRDTLRDLLATVGAAGGDEGGPPVGEVMAAMWERVSSPELAPFVRLFFECVAAAPGLDLTGPWLDAAEGDGPDGTAVTPAGAGLDAVDVRLGTAVMRGLLIDVLAGDRAGADEAMVRFIERFDPDRSR